MTTKADVRELKKQASYKAAQHVKDGMIVGLGTGSTAAFVVEALAERVTQGLNFIAIATSNQTAELAKKAGITLTDFSKHQQIDLTIDGADEVEVGTLNLIKGKGGALVREKLVASASKKLLIVVDETKVVDRLGDHTAIPVEVVPFAWQTTAQRLMNLGSGPKLRMDEHNQPYITDNSNYIIDCDTGPIHDAPGLAEQIKLTGGVVECGLFIKMTSLVVVGRSSGVDLLKSAS